MKRLITTTVLTFIVGVQAQTNVNFLVDTSLHMAVELERVEENWYAKTAFEYAPNIEGGYTVLGASLGYSKVFGVLEDLRFYVAPKIQFIRRGGYTYPSYGAELGFDRTFNSGFILGVRGTYDYRSDFEFWGHNSAEFRPSVFFKVGFNL